MKFDECAVRVGVGKALVSCINGRNKVARFFFLGGFLFVFVVLGLELGLSYTR